MKKGQVFLTQSKFLLLWTLLSVMLILSGYFDIFDLCQVFDIEFAIAAFYSFIMDVPHS